MATIFLRTVMFFCITVLSLRLMGKRQIGELEPTELVVTILISDISTLCLQDINLPVLYAVIPISVLVIFEVITSVLSLKSPAIRRAFSGNYSVIIENGKLNQSEMHRAEVTLDEVMEEIRKKGGLVLEDVQFCVLETSGQMSVILKKDTKHKKVPIPLIVDGCLLKKNLKKAGLTRPLVEEMYRRHGAKTEKDVFWLALQDGAESYVRKAK